MESGSEELLVAIVMVAIVASLGIIHALDRFRLRQAEERRSAKLFQLATALGLEFQPGRNMVLPLRYGFIQKLLQGQNRQARNVVTGTYGGHQVCAFDFHYETTNPTADEPKTHEISILLLHLPANFAEVLIARKSTNWFLSAHSPSADIPLDSHEFNQLFSVRAEDRKAAYDICHPRMMEYLLAHPDLSLEYDLDVIALIAGRRLQPEEIHFNFNRLLELRDLVPDYLLTAA